MERQRDIGKDDRNAAAGRSAAPSSTTNGKARVLVVDDHPVLREGVQILLNRQKDLTCCACTGSVTEAQSLLSSQKTDLLLLDLCLGNADGLEAIKGFKALFPNLRILILSQLDESLYAERALRAGALGYVMKEQATSELLNAIRTVLKGQLYVSPRMNLMALQRILHDKSAAHAGSDLGALTDRELQVFKLIGEGHANKQIAASLNLSVKTIETYREHIKHKLGFANGSELVNQARMAAQPAAPRA